jgi:hypothetical protein
VDWFSEGGGDRGGVGGVGGWVGGGGGGGGGGGARPAGRPPVGGEMGPVVGSARRLLVLESRPEGLAPAPAWHVAGWQRRAIPSSRVALAPHKACSQKERRMCA